VKSSALWEVSIAEDIEISQTYRFSHTRPSVAVCFFSLSSLSTSSWSVSERAGAASCRSRIFWVLVSFFHYMIASWSSLTLTLPLMSLLTGLNAAEPMTSDATQSAPVARATTKRTK